MLLTTKHTQTEQSGGIDFLWPLSATSMCAGKNKTVGGGGVGVLSSVEYAIRCVGRVKMQHAILNMSVHALIILLASCQMYLRETIMLVTRQKQKHQC